MCEQSGNLACLPAASCLQGGTQALEPLQQSSGQHNEQVEQSIQQMHRLQQTTDTACAHNRQCLAPKRDGEVRGGS